MAFDEAASRLIRTRWHALASLWAPALAGEAGLYFLFLRKPFLGPLLTLLAVAVLFATLVATWRVARSRTGEDRRRGERRHVRRRADERS
jgi:hypothetical protein